MIRRTAFAVAAVGLAALLVFPLDRNVLLVGRWERSLRPHGNDVHGADVIQSVESILALFHGHAPPPPPPRTATGEDDDSSLSSSFPLLRRLTFYFPSPKHSSWQLHGWLYLRKDGRGRADVQRGEEENNKAATKPKSKKSDDDDDNNNNNGAKTTRKPPLVVMANGLGAQKDGGLDVIAAEFAAKGFAAFIFDYGRWGGSDGTPRHIAIPNEMLNDLLAALRFVAFSPEVAAVADTARIALWGTSLGGGHVLSMAARLAVEGKIAELDFSAAAAGGGGRDSSSSDGSSSSSSSSPASPTKGGGGGSSTSSTSPSSSPTSSGEERGGGLPSKTEMRELRRRLGCVVSQIPFISGKVQAMMSAAVRPFTTKVRLAAAILGDTAREWIGRDDLLPPIYVPLASPISPLTNNNNNTSSSPLPSSSSTPSSKGDDSDADDDDDDEQGERKKRDVSSSTPGDGSSVSSSSGGGGGGSVEYDDDDEHHHHHSYGNEMGALLLEENDYSDWLSKVPSSSAWKKTALSLSSRNSKNRQSETTTTTTTTKSSRQFNRMFLGPWKNALAARSLFHLALYEPIDKVRDIEVPTLVVVARDDKVCDVKMAHRVADLLNGKEEDDDDDDEGEERSSEEKKKKKKSSSSSSSTKEQQQQEEMAEIEQKENNNNNNNDDDGGAEGWRRRKASIVSIPATHFTLYFDEMRQVAVESATRFLDEHLVHHRRADY